MLKYLILTIMFYWCGHVYAQSLFENALDTNTTLENESVRETRYELNGFVRGAYFGGKTPNEDNGEEHLRGIRA